MQGVNQFSQVTLEGIGRMVKRELNWLNVNIIAYDVGCQDMSLRIVDQPPRGIQYLVLNVLAAGLFCQFITTQHLPVIQPAQEYQHANANKQKDEHLPTACAA